MAIISLGKIDKNIIPVFIGCIVCFLSRLLFLYDGTTLFNHEIIANILVEFSKLFMIIPHIILFNRTYNVNKAKDINNQNTKLQLLYNDYSDDELITNKNYKIVIIIFSSVLYFIQSIILIYTIEIASNTWILDILFTLIFYYLIFKIKLYKHHYLSIIFIIVTGIILDIVLENLQKDISEYYYLLFLRLVREIIYSSIEVMNKYLMDKQFCSVYIILFYNGLIETILLGIFSILNYFYFKLDNFQEYFENFTYTEIFVILGLIITQLGLSLFALFINKNNTPCHIFIIYVFGKFAYYNDSTTNSIVKIICLIFIFFMSLVFCEIIELNFFGLSHNTKNKIVKRALTEATKSEKKDINNEEDDEENQIKFQLENLDDSLFYEQEL